MELTVEPQFVVDVLMARGQQKLGMEADIADQGRLALVARPETTDLQKIPESTSKDNVLVEYREIRLSENGPASVIEKTQPGGRFCLRKQS